MFRLGFHQPGLLAISRSRLVYFFLLTFPRIRVKMSNKASSGFPMSATAQASRPASLNRRRRVRQKVHAPAYATFSGASSNGMLDLCEILDISEVGVAIQCASPMQIGQEVDLSLDLAEARGQISAPAHVVWSDSAGRVGFGLAPLPGSALHNLREWLFLNAMAGAANAASDATPQSTAPRPSLIRPNYTDTLTAVTAVQREAESLGSDVEAILSLVASRSQSLLHASGAAIALAGKDVETTRTMICRASSGPSAPPVGAALQVGSGFSGECVRTGTILRCDDAETDDRVDRESCRALGIRSLLAAPLRSDEKVIGLLEIFSAQPNSFDDKDGAILQRFAETIVAAVNHAAKPADPAPPPFTRVPFIGSPGSILFAPAPEESSEENNEENREGSSKKDAKNLSADEDKVGGIRLPRAHLYLLICAAATIALALGFILAPWIQPWFQGTIQRTIHERLQARARNGEQTVLASSRPPAEATAPAFSVSSANVDQLREMAARGDASAENALGLLYAQGDEKQSIKPDDSEAAAWFTKAAEHGNLSAQYKLGLLYWGGHHGLPKDANKAYFWTVLARAGGQESSKDLAKVLANGMTRAQAAAIEQQAEIWYQQHESNTKPSPAR
jgi:putative methionine-R-sulfoxide reductase with GAF domain